MKIGVAGTWKYGENDVWGLAHSDSLLNLLQNQGPTATQPGQDQGQGTQAKPYSKLSMQNYYYLAKADLPDAPQFFSVGKRLLARWGNGAGDLKNYVTDVTDYQSKLPKDIADQKDYSEVVHRLGDAFVEADKLLKIPADLPAYTRKALRATLTMKDFDDRAAAAQCRQLLLDSDTDCTNCPELASTFLSLFVAEASRRHEIFLVSLMLLDLVETATTYGDEKKYTWKSMLMYGNGAMDIPGRSKGVKELGKHPMSGKGTVEDANKMFIGTCGTNLVRDRVISLMAVWTAHYLALKQKDAVWYIIQADKAHEPWTGARHEPKLRAKGGPDKNDTMVLSQCRKAVAARADNPNRIIGGTTVEYVKLSEIPDR
jgi:hypothetical protein